ncbi:hypothetical protein VITFI_CDS0731 [Vitreoscilla filiformis]|uniref:Uncharacterized protein n=1 Tax=Vitreoscilla filiformis TaxID=63 RepID=A0A221KCE6_VITFI|nr:hypothetical protein VITFI_CDS0731 [Vitreoscilla filiformis]
MALGHVFFCRLRGDGDARLPGRRFQRNTDQHGFLLLNARLGRECALRRISQWVSRMSLAERHCHSAPGADPAPSSEKPGF